MTALPLCKLFVHYYRRAEVQARLRPNRPRLRATQLRKNLVRFRAADVIRQ